MWWTWIAAASAGDDLGSWQAACEAATGDPSARVSLHRTDAGWQVSCAGAVATVEPLPTEHRARVELLWVALARGAPATALLGPPPPVGRPPPPPPPPEPEPAPEPVLDLVPVEVQPAMEVELPLPPPPPVLLPPPSESASRKPKTEATIAVGLAGLPTVGARKALAVGVRYDQAVVRVVGTTSGRLQENDDGHWVSLGVESGVSLGTDRIRAEATFGLAVREEVGLADDVSHAIPGLAGQLVAGLGPTPFAIAARVDFDLATTSYPDIHWGPDGLIRVRTAHAEPFAVGGALITRFGGRR